MTTQEKVKKIRDITMSPFNKINDALEKSNGDVDKAIELLVIEKQADNADIANRIANCGVVHSYVHNNKIGAMLVLVCQTDFVAKNEVFLSLAKDICMHIVSSPIQAEYPDENSIPLSVKEHWQNEYAKGLENKSINIATKIVEGKLTKKFGELCLLNQKFIKDDKVTIKQLIQSVSSTLGEKIEIKKFTRMSN